MSQQCYTFILRSFSRGTQEYCSSQLVLFKKAQKNISNDMSTLLKR